MDNHDAQQLIQVVNTLDPAIETIDDAIYYAMQHVENFQDKQWFGEIGDGVFYADPDRCMFFANSNRMDAYLSLVTEFGPLLTDTINV